MRETFAENVQIMEKLLIGKCTMACTVRGRKHFESCTAKKANPQGSRERGGTTVSAESAAEDFQVTRQENHSLGATTLGEDRGPFKINLINLTILYQHGLVVL
jgi:hypothetical protein